MDEPSTSERSQGAGLPAAPGRRGVPKVWRPRWKRLLILISGWAFVVLGVLGLFLPFLQGFLFLAIGFYLLSLESVWARRLMDRMRARWPNLAEKMDEARRRAARFARRLRR